jgi:hypothetical protein
MTCPVERSAILGGRGTKSFAGLSSVRSLKYSAGPAPLSKNTGAALCTKLAGIVSSALLVESLPPAITTSHSPRSIAAAARVTA